MSRLANPKRSSIGWTDYSGGCANFVLRGTAAGDCECSPECEHCYARAILLRSNAAGEHTTYSVEKLIALSRWEPKDGGEAYRRGPGSRPLCFVCDMGDLCHPNVPDEFIRRALGVLTLRTDVDWQILTKRPARLARLLVREELPAHLWVGTTAGTQKGADERIPDLLRVNAAVKFVSMEPLLEAVDLNRAVWGKGRPYPPLDVQARMVSPTYPGWSDGFTPLRSLDWVIVGAESGPKRRPFEVAWAREIREQCRAAGVPFFGKQAPGPGPGVPLLIDGREWKEFPK